jgi:hypothetical protein
MLFILFLSLSLFLTTEYASCAGVADLQVSICTVVTLSIALLHRYKQGLVEALHLVAEPQDSREVPAALQFIAAYMLKVISGINYVHSLFRPHIRVRF